ncbi:MAG: hypothetical protein K2G32_10460 [Oscillospiraceae bacterium]|nr:hypothetical protein [Oscillospiraceae bacterium]
MTDKSKFEIFCPGYEPEGKSLDELTEKFGEPWKIEEHHDYSIRTWWNEKLFAVLMFNINNICFNLLDEGKDGNRA